MVYQVLVRFPDVHKSVVERARVSPAVLVVCSRVDKNGRCGFGETVRFLVVRGGKGV
jgi:hypothetical protein